MFLNIVTFNCLFMKDFHLIAGKLIFMLKTISSFRSSKLIYIKNIVIILQINSINKILEKFQWMKKNVITKTNSKFF